MLSGKAVVGISASPGHCLALCSDGTVAAWGGNSFGELGNGIASANRVLAPVSVVTSGVLAGKEIVAVSAGSHFSVALCSDGTLASWGLNDPGGRLGNNDWRDSSVPVLVSTSGALAGKKVVSVSAGGFHTIALCSDGTLVTWGENEYGQLGNGGTNDSRTPVNITHSGVLSGKTVTMVSAGSQHSLALCSDGTLAAWGENHAGQLGNQSRTDSHVPIAVSRSGVLAGKTIDSLSASENNSLAYCSDGTMAIWGTNVDRQLGNGTNSYESTIPVAVNTQGLSSGEFVVSAASGSFGNHSIAIVAVPISAPRLVAITLAGLYASYDGLSKSPVITTDPPGIPVELTYNGSSTAPTQPGSYDIIARVVESGYTGSVSGTLLISDPGSLSIKQVSTQIEIEFLGILQQSINLSGPDGWKDVTPQPASPWRFTPLESKMFFRIKP
jgi:hypothetical protein